MIQSYLPPTNHIVLLAKCVDRPAANDRSNNVSLVDDERFDYSTKNTAPDSEDVAASDVSDVNMSLSSASADDNASDDMGDDVNEASATDNIARTMRKLQKEAFLDTAVVMSPN